MNRILAIAALSLMAGPASADSASEAFCRDMAAVVYQGTVDGYGDKDFAASLVKATVTIDRNPVIRRVAIASYMLGYASGLMFEEPAVAAANFYNGCISEGA